MARTGKDLRRSYRDSDRIAANLLLFIAAGVFLSLSILMIISSNFWPSGEEERNAALLIVGLFGGFAFLTVGVWANASLMDDRRRRRETWRMLYRRRKEGTVKSGRQEAKVSGLRQEGMLELCVVCRRPANETASLVQCPNCGAIAHRVHMLEYLHVKGHCPICKAHLDEEQLAEYGLKGEV